MTKIEIPDAMVQFTDEELEAQRMLMWHCFSQYITPSIQCVVEFAKRVPGIVSIVNLVFSSLESTVCLILFIWDTWKTCTLANCADPD